VSFDWRKEFQRQHGHAPDAASEARAAGGGNAASSAQAIAPAKPEGGCKGPDKDPPAPVIRVSESPVPDPDVDPLTGGSEEGAAPMVEVAPGQFVNERAAQALGLAAPTSAMGRLVRGRPT